MWSAAVVAAPAAAEAVAAEAAALDQRQRHAAVHR
jgi:hypothetical protein